MSPYDFVHLAIHALGDEVRGRTKLQKTIYFLGILTGNLDELGYRAHYYGPYSDAVASSVNRLKALGFLQQSSLHTGAFSADGFEIARHDFILTDEGNRIAKQKANQSPESWKKITNAVSRFRKGGDINYMRMSVAAKTFFILSEKGQPATALELCESAKALGWTPKPEDIAESVEFLKKLGLASANPLSPNVAAP
jgi:uncharacterized protein YwgA